MTREKLTRERTRGNDREGKNLVGGETLGGYTQLELCEGETRIGGGKS